MEKIHVLVLDTVMDRGGAEAMIMNYMRHIDRDKIQIDFMVNRQYRGAYEDEIESLGGKVYRMSPMYPGKFHKYKKEFREFLEKHPEYKIIHSNLEERSYLPLKVAKKMGVKVRISHAHNRPLGFNLKTPFRWYFRFMLKFYNTHMFACGNEAACWLYGKKNLKNVTIMNNAIDTEDYKYDLEKSRRMKEKLNVSDKLVIGHVGRFFQQKNHMFLIDIFNEIAKIRKDAVLLLVGGGELNDELKNKVKDKVENLGLSDKVKFLGVRSDVADILQAFDVFLLPSLFEGLPVTMVEAQSAGLPCVISDKVPIQCDITGNVLVKNLEDSPEEWAKSVIEYTENFKRKDTTMLIKEHGFDIRKNAEWLEKCYTDMYNSY